MTTTPTYAASALVAIDIHDITSALFSELLAWLAANKMAPQRSSKPGDGSTFTMYVLPDEAPLVMRWLAQNAKPSARPDPYAYRDALADGYEAHERTWIAGQRSALTSMLSKVLGELGYQDTEATRAKWIVEREQTIARLREACADWGDNDWTETLHLRDVIDKHLLRHLDEDGEEDTSIADAVLLVQRALTLYAEQTHDTEKFSATIKGLLRSAVVLLDVDDDDAKERALARVQNVRRVFTLATTLGRHWRDQGGFSGELLDELVKLISEDLGEPASPPHPDGEPARHLHTGEAKVLMALSRSDLEHVAETAPESAGFHQRAKIALAMLVGAT